MNTIAGQQNYEKIYFIINKRITNIFKRMLYFIYDYVCIYNIYKYVLYDNESNFHKLKKKLYIFISFRLRITS